MSSTNELRARLATHDEVFVIEGIADDVRKIPLSYGRHVRSWHPMRLGHPPAHCESKLESRTISVLLQFPQLRALKTQPITVSYRPYGGRLHQYTPDLLVEFTSVPEVLQPLGFGIRTYVEVKPQRLALQAEDRLRHKFAALRQATDMPVVLLTDWDLPVATEEASYVF